MKMKTKKILSLALSLVMIIASFALPASAKTISVTYELQENFADNVLEGDVWTAFGTAGASTVTEGALQISADQSGAGITLANKLVADEKVKISFKMKFSATTAAGGVAITNNNKYNATTNPNGTYNYNTLFRVVLGGDGSVGYAMNYGSTDYYNGDFPMGGLAKANVTPNTWNDVDLVLDTHSNTFSLWVNDACMVDRSTASGMTVGHGQNPTFTGADKIDLYNAGVHSAGTGNVLFDDFEITRNVSDEIVPTSYFFTDFDDVNGDASYIKSYDCFDSMYMPWAIDRVNVAAAGQPANYVMQIADRNNGSDAQLRMKFDEKVTTGILTVEFDYKAVNGVIPRLLFDQTADTRMRFIPVLENAVFGPGNLDSGDSTLEDASSLIGIKNSFTYDAASGSFGYTEAIYNEWVHVKYEYDMATGKSVVEYGDTVLTADDFSEAFTKSFKESGIHGIVFENVYGAAGNYYWIDNLKITNQGEGESSANLGSYDSNFNNGTSFWTKTYGAAEVVESDDNHGNSIQFYPIVGKNDGNFWYYHEYTKPFTSGKLTWSFSACPVKGATNDEESRAQFAICGAWGLAADKASTVLFDKANNTISGAGSYLCDFTYGEWYDVTMTVDLDTIETENMSVTIMDANGDVLATRNDLVYPKDEIIYLMVQGFYGDKGIYYDNHEISYEAPAPAIANINVYDALGSKVTDLANIPAYVDTIEVEFNTNVDLEGLADKIYIETNDDNFTKINTKGSLLGNKYTLKLDDAALAPDTSYCVVVEKGVKNTDGVATTSNSYTDIHTAEAKLDATFTGSSAENVSAIIAGSTISVNLTAENTSGTSVYPYMIIAYRNGSQSVHVDIAKLNLTVAETDMAAGNITVCRKVPLDIPAFDSVKVLLWDGIDTIKPIADDFVIQ